MPQIEVFKKIVSYHRRLWIEEVMLFDDVFEKVVDIQYRDLFSVSKNLLFSIYNFLEFHFRLIVFKNYQYFKTNFSIFLKKNFTTVVGVCCFHSLVLPELAASLFCFFLFHSIYSYEIQAFVT